DGLAQPEAVVLRARREQEAVGEQEEREAGALRARRRREAGEGRLGVGPGALDELLWPVADGVELVRHVLEDGGERHRIERPADGLRRAEDAERPEAVREHREAEAGPPVRLAGDDPGG